MTERSLTKAFWASLTAVTISTGKICGSVYLTAGVDYWNPNDVLQTGAKVLIDLINVDQSNLEFM